MAGLGAADLAFSINLHMLKVFQTNEGCSRGILAFSMSWRISLCGLWLVSCHSCVNGMRCGKRVKEILYSTVELCYLYLLM